MYLHYELLYPGIILFGLLFAVAPSCVWGGIGVVLLHFPLTIWAYGSAKIGEPYLKQLLVGEIHILLMFAVFCLLKYIVG